MITTIIMIIIVIMIMMIILVLGRGQMGSTRKLLT